jgi:flap endonuclease-1
MGVNLRELLIKHKIELEDLKGKKLAVDTYNILFQFLSTIRQPDGTLLTDSKGNVTSHLSGLFYRTINLLEAGIKPAFVFDGQAPEEKVGTQIAREAIREEARAEYAKALAAGQLEEARKFAQQTSRLTKDMVHESKELLSAMGLPWVQAFAEGEAQAAYMCSKGDVWAVASQDYDSLLFAAPRLVRNLTITGKRKVNAKTVDVEIEIIDLAECLNFLGIDIKQLVELGLLAGTDYNPGGVSGIGPKTALKVVREKKFSDYSAKIPNAERLKQLFLKPLVAKDYSLEWKAPNARKIKDILVDRHEFSEDRIDIALKRMEKAPAFQKGLGDFI